MIPEDQFKFAEDDSKHQGNGQEPNIERMYEIQEMIDNFHDALEDADEIVEKAKGFLTLQNIGIVFMIASVVSSSNMDFPKFNNGVELESLLPPALLILGVIMFTQGQDNDEQ